MNRRADTVAVVGRRVPLVKRGGEYEARCPFHTESTPSFKVNADKQIWKCFGCGAGGGPVGFVMQFDKLDFPEAVKRLAEELGIVVAAGAEAKPLAAMVVRRSDADQRAEKDRSVERGRGIWNAARSAIGSPVETYLKSRGIGIAPPVTLRYAPNLEYWQRYDEATPAELIGHWPAMVGYVQGPDGGFCAAHVTYLAQDAQSKARIFCPRTGAVLPVKKMHGRPWGGGLRFTHAARRMFVGEGIETCLSVYQALRDTASGSRNTNPTLGGNEGGLLDVDRNVGFWAALSLNNIAGAGLGEGATRTDKWREDGSELRLPSTEPDAARPGIVFPPEVAEIVILEDGDNKDQLAADALYTRAALRWRTQGRTVLRARPPRGMDFNDVLVDAPADAPQAGDRLPRLSPSASGGLA